MAKQLQASLTGGEISPSLYGRTDLAKFATSLGACRNFFVRPTGGASNRAGLEFVYALDPTSLACLIPFVFSTTQSYMLVFQEATVQIFTQGAFVQNALATATITNIVEVAVGFFTYRQITTAAPHGFTAGDTVLISGVVATGSYAISGNWLVASVVSPTVFRIAGSGDPSGAYTSGGTATIPIVISTPYLSEDLASLRYTQSADVVTIVNQLTKPYEFVRLSASLFSFGAIADFEGGPFLDDNVTATTVKASAATGVGITLTASTAIFVADHVGALFRLTIEDLSAIPPWEPNKFIAAGAVDPDGLLRQSNGKVYVAANNAAAPAAGTYTGTKAPDWSEGIQSDGDGNLLNGLANTRAGVSWQFLHPGFGIARITAIGGGGTTATADVLDYMPVVTPATSTIWAFGAWSEDQGYPAIVTYFSDRLVFANSPGAPQTEWASKTGDYHNFARSSPLVPNDSIRQPLNARQINAIVELIPMDQLVALTSSSSWASPKRGESWTPTTIGYDPQSFDGAAFLRAIQTGDSALFAQAGGTKVRDLKFKNEAGKFVGDELTVMARHLFDSEHVIVDMDYAKEPHGILWIVRSDGVLIGLTYLPEQEVVGWHRHDTDGFFERVCVIPEDGVDTPYFVVRRTVGGATVRYLERMAIRDRSSILDAFFVDSGLTYDGRNGTATTVAISGASYVGGATVTLTASAPIFAASDVGSDAIQFPSADGNVRANISAFTSSTIVSATLQSPVPVALQGVATTTWTFARDTFSGLSHLEGKTVAILADGSPEVQQVVTSGSVTLPYPAGVVHIGLPYVGELETLNVNLFNSPVSITDSSQVIPKVSVLVEKTLGLKAGPDAANLFDFGLQPTDFDYNAPWALQTETQDTFVVTDWKKRGHILLRQDGPLPATVLTITPNVEVGGSSGGQQ
jgi:hypothetical protein